MHFPDYRQGSIPYKPKVNGGVAQSIRKQAIKRRQSERVAFFDIKEENWFFTETWGIECNEGFVQHLFHVPLDNEPRTVWFHTGTGRGLSYAFPACMAEQPTTPSPRCKAAFAA